MSCRVRTRRSRRALQINHRSSPIRSPIWCRRIVFKARNLLADASSLPFAADWPCGGLTNDTDQPPAAPRGKAEGAATAVLVLTGLVSVLAGLIRLSRLQHHRRLSIAEQDGRNYFLKKEIAVLDKRDRGNQAPEGTDAVVAVAQADHRVLAGRSCRGGASAERNGEAGARGVYLKIAETGWSQDTDGRLYPIQCARVQH